MTKPHIYKIEPIKITLEKGKQYGFCTCGYTTTSPFCDGEHKEKAPEFKSIKFCAIENFDAWFCQCKNSKNSPFCDGTHKGLKS